MSNFQSYNTFNGGDPAAFLQPTHSVESARNVGGTTSVVSRDGVMTEEFRGQDKGRVSENNPHHGTDSVLATAQHPKGLPVYAIEDSTLITVNGVQATAAFWAREGVLSKAADGTYGEASGAPQVAPEVVSEDTVALHPDHAQVLQQALGDMPESHAMAVASAVIGEACGKLAFGASEAKFSGITGEQNSPRLQAIQAVFQAQADGVLQHKLGIGAEDLESFYADCRNQNRDQMQDAISRQVHGNDMGGWRKLATQWLANNAPSVEALQRAGLQVRKSHHKAGSVEVFISKGGAGWMSPEAAAKAGLI